MKYFMAIALLTASVYSHAATEGHLVCTQDNRYVFLVDGDEVHRIIEDFGIKYYNDWGLTYGVYSTRDFSSVTFGDETKTFGVFSMGEFSPYNGVDRDSVVEKELSQSFCE